MQWPEPSNQGHTLDVPLEFSKRDDDGVRGRGCCGGESRHKKQPCLAGAPWVRIQTSPFANIELPVFDWVFYGLALLALPNGLQLIFNAQGQSHVQLLPA